MTARSAGDVMIAYPLIMQPLLKQRRWGDCGLASLNKPVAPGEGIGESWELADLAPPVEAGRSRIANGPFAGRTLHEVLERHAQDIMGAARLTEAGGFPLLLKYLDAHANLSVQVHPSVDYARTHPEAHIKSEAWVIIEAKPDAVIYKGLRPGVTRETFAEHLRSGDVVHDLNRIPVHPGECHYLPTGTCHALGAGVLVAEVQTPSDTTFRLYDWGREGSELHIDAGLECIQFGQAIESTPSSLSPLRAGGTCTVPLVNTDHFAIERITAEAPTQYEVVTNGVPEAWMALDGRAVLRSNGRDDVPLRRGDTVLLPASLEGWSAQLDGDAVFLRITLPSPVESMIA